MKVCSKCEKVRPLSEFKPKWPSVCRSCRTAHNFKYFKAWVERNRDARNARSRILKAERAWSIDELEKRRAASRAHAAKTRPQRAAACAKRYAAKMRAVPRWANDFFMQEAYALAALRTAVTGFRWQVDHIVPLQSLVVCGLHVHNNLQVIPATANAKKGNRHWPGMP